MRLVPILLLACACLIAGGCVRTGLVQMEASTSRVEATLVGDVRTVASGQGADPARLARVPPGYFRVATGYGVLGQDGDPAKSSQILLLGPHAIQRSVEVGRLGELERGGDGVLASFAVGLRADARPAARYRVQGRVELLEAVREIAVRHGPHAYIVGVGDFAVAEGRGMTRPPTSGQEVFGERRGAHFQEGLVVLDSPLFFAGAIADAPRSVTGRARAAFWFDPARETLTDEVGELYGAVLRTRSGVTPEDPASAAQHATSLMALDMRSVLTSGTILVYEVRSFEAR